MPDPAPSTLPVPSCYREPETAARIALVAQSYARLLGRPLVPAGDDPVAALWAAPCVIVAHGTEVDPVFFFGNARALEAFEISLEDFVRLPSRLSAEAPNRAEREDMLARVTRDGFIDDYRGMRISARGTRFMIGSGIVWNLIDADGIRHGQAATFDWPA
ncbi:MEKHLA domain-containing protein [Novosphingobium colocasiae]|uniref:MEKHLA domain-containing protein n=1 Tax=Novosphingobium colocasiae TaxID=1256513 RepID=UPI001676B865|nr:MEKHLA domain-containing protein [Novosphingobium colocasiae]